jgi:Rieske 2Fe-2S family protein
LTWLWHVTSIADKRIIELNQQGVNSAHYVPGPYTEMEVWSRCFVEWYLHEIA